MNTSERYTRFLDGVAKGDVDIAAQLTLAENLSNISFQLHRIAGAMESAGDEPLENGHDA